MNQSISKKIAFLNQTTLDSLLETADISIIQRFVESGLKILGADFGFAWWKAGTDDSHTLIYKSAEVPYEPNLPRERGGNFEAEKNKKPVFVEEVLTENYEPEYDVSPYMKSYVIIPVLYKNHIYGSLVLCFKEKRVFTEEDKGLAISLGTTAAQTITIHNLIEKESEVRKKANESRVLEQLLQEEKLKIEFIANATHEIRTPIAIIKGNVDLATRKKSGRLKSPQSALKAIDHEVMHLSNILADLTLMTYKEGEVRNKIVHEYVNLNTLVLKVVGRCKTLAYKKNISITTRKIPDMHLLGDSMYLEKMLINLVKNSIMYGRKNGHIKIVVKAQGENTLIDVIDDGIGIPEEDLPYIFERFYKVDKSHSSHKNSTGLGLAIVKWIVSVHRGTIDVKSLQKGTQVTVSLPVYAE